MFIEVLNHGFGFAVVPLIKVAIGFFPPIINSVKIFCGSSMMNHA